jgi:hypothetical protein
MFRTLLRSRSRHTVCRQPLPMRPTLEILEDRLAPAAIHWINTNGGDWSDPTNWSTGTVPGPSDDVLIDVGGNITVTHSTGTDTILSLVNQQNLTVIGNSSRIVTGFFNQTGARTLTADQGAAFAVGGAATLDGANVFALSGSTISLPGASGYDGSVGPNKTIRADGAGSQINLPGVTQLIGAGGAGDGSRVAFEALNGGSLNLSQVPGLVSGNAWFSAQGTSSQIDLSALTSFTGARNDVNYLQADGTGSQLDLSAVTQLIGAGGAGDSIRVLFNASNGGSVNLSHVTGISSGNASFSAQGTSSRIDLSALTRFTGARNDASSLSATQGGTILLGTTVTVGNVAVVLDPTSRLTVTTLQLSTGGILTVVTSSGASTLTANLVNDGEVRTPTATDSLTITGTCTQTQGSVTGPGTLTITGRFTWAGGSMIGGSVVNANGGLVLSGTTTRTLDGDTFNNAGAATWTGSGDLVMGHGAVFNNLATATFDVQTDQSIINPLGGTATFNNAGTFSKSAGTGPTTVQAVFSSPGPVQINSGTLSSSVGGSISGSVSNSGTLSIGTGITFPISGAYSGTGTLLVSPNARLNLTGSFSNLTGTTLTAGTCFVAGILQLPNANIVTNGGIIVLDGPAAQIVDQSGNNALANLAANVTGGSFLVLDGRNFQTVGGFSNAGALGVGDGCTVVITGPLANFSGTTLLGGTWLISGTLQFPGANLVSNASTLLLNGPNGRILDEMGHNALANFANNAAGGLLSVENGRSFTTPGNFSNDGTVAVRDRGILTISGQYSQTGGTAVQSGGTLVLAGGGIAGGVFLVDSTLSIAAGTTFAATGNWTQTGTVIVPATATLILAGSFANFSGTTLSSGTYLIGGTFQFVGANIVTNAATLLLDGATSAILDDMGRNALAGFATNTSTGSFTLQNGRSLTTTVAFRNAGSVTVGAGSTFSAGGAWTQTGGSTTLTGGSLTASGLVDIQGGVLSGSGTINANVHNADNVAVAGGNTLTINGTYTQTGGSTTLTGGSLTASGLVDIQGGVLSGSGTLQANVRNAGNVAVATGNPLTINGTFTQVAGGNTTLTGGSLTASGLVDIQGGILGGVGTINASVRNAGELVLGALGSTGRMSITGTYTQTASGLLHLDLAGPSAGTGYDQLVINGQATLAGALEVILINGYVPTHGASFQLVTFGGGHGTTTFDTVNVDPSLLPPTYNTNDVTVVAQ